MVLVVRICQNCGEPFDIEEWAIRQGRGKYCSQICSQADRHGPRLAGRKRIIKQCVVCGKDFETGGRAGDVNKRFCGMECQRLGRYRSGRVCNELDPMDASYLAGFWDGEGCFIIHGRNNNGGSISFRVAAVGTKEVVIRWIQEVTGIGTIVHRPSTNAKWAQRWEWWVNGDGAESFARQMLPYLKLKPEQAALGIAFQERLRDPKFKADRSWQEEWRLRMREMNRRGPAEGDLVLTETVIVRPT